jgi:guanylate kinase/signal peptidase I
MARFETIAVPHDDIAKGRFTMDVYAANLWEVFNQTKSCPAEYKDSREFFNKTYLTIEMHNLLASVEQRMKGNGSDPVIQLQTPFGGGKTHTLIALYHKATEWKANVVVIVGEDINTGSDITKFDTLWGLLEKQLTGKIKDFSGPIPPGGEQLKRLLENYSPVLILLDELIPYLNKADAVDAGNKKTLSSLTLTFLQTLTNVVSSVPNACLVFTTTPSNPYDRTEKGLRLVKDLQTITGRKDSAKSPVQDDEVSQIIRTRLFKNISQKGAEIVINEFVEYVEKNSLLPPDIPPTEYRKKFQASYPFLPEVIDVLYQRWGSFSEFQRTRGVLRLLALVVHAAKEKGIPYISLADFDLSIQDLRRELVKFTGPQFESIIVKDITSPESGANKLNLKVPESCRSLKLGSRTASAIFMYSFTGGMEAGITLTEAKRAATTMDNLASAISDVLEESKNCMFYLKHTGSKYIFTTEPTLYSVVNVKMDNIKMPSVEELQRKIFNENINNNRLKNYYLPRANNDVPDTPDFKLVVFSDRDETAINELIEKKGISPRVNRNTIFAMVPMESEKSRFENILKKYLAYEDISKDATLNLSTQQLSEVLQDLKKLKGGLREDFRNLYRVLLIPDKSGFKEMDMGIPTYGDTKKIDDEIFDRLRSEGDILQKIVPLVIKEKYLKEKKFVHIDPIYTASLTTRGETRFETKDILLTCIHEGVKNGVFGVGILDDEKPVCKYYKEQLPVIDYGDYILIEPLYCKEQKVQEKSEQENKVIGTATLKGTDEIRESESVIEKPNEGSPPIPTMREVTLQFDIPYGKTSNLVGMLNLLQRNFQKLNINIHATEGEITEQDHEDKIKETLRQMGIEA